jgi:hypothetical protein
LFFVYTACKKVDLAKNIDKWDLFFVYTACKKVEQAKNIDIWDLGEEEGVKTFQDWIT